MGDLPAGVMRQWRRWCLHADYLVGVEPGARDAYARLRLPLLSLSFTDDRMMPQRNVDALQAHLSGVRRESPRLSPADAGGLEEFLTTLNFLIDRARRERGGGAAKK